jgi:hypothetical protein
MPLATDWYGHFFLIAPIRVVVDGRSDVMTALEKADQLKPMIEPLSSGADVMLVPKVWQVLQPSHGTPASPFYFLSSPNGNSTFADNAMV